MTQEFFTGPVLASLFAATTLYFMISTAIRIHRDIGISTTRGFLWLLLVLVGNLLGVILYRFFRGPTEYVFESLFGIR